MAEPRESYLDDAMAALGRCLHSYTGQQAQAVALLLKRRVQEEREACALLHEQVDVSDGVEPMALAIAYRDLIRARGDHPDRADAQSARPEGDRR